MDEERGGAPVSSAGGTRGMSELAARPRWRDALVLMALAAVIIGGRLHYSGAPGNTAAPPAADPPPAPPAGTSESPTATQTPSSEATAELDSARPTDPASPAPTGGTCWDGRETSALRLCGLPAGARGLAWVFPSFARDRDQCHPARPNDDSYPVVESFECFQRALGQAVTVTYDEVKDPAQVEDWLVARIGARHRHEIPGAHG